MVSTLDALCIKTPWNGKVSENVALPCRGELENRRPGLETLPVLAAIESHSCVGQAHGWKLKAFKQARVE